MNLDNYRDILEIPRVDDKKIVYTLKFWNNSWGKVDFLDLKDGKTYEGKFALVKYAESEEETNIHFVLEGDFGFFNTDSAPHSGNPEMILNLNTFLNTLTKPFTNEL